MRGLAVLIGRARSRGVGGRTGFMLTASSDSSKRSECLFERASIVGNDFAGWCEEGGGISVWLIIWIMEVGGVGIGD